MQWHNVLNWIYLNVNRAFFSIQVIIAFNNYCCYRFLRLNYHHSREGRKVGCKYTHGCEQLLIHTNPSTPAEGKGTQQLLHASPSLRQPFPSAPVTVVTKPPQGHDSAFAVTHIRDVIYLCNSPMRLQRRTLPSGAKRTGDVGSPCKLGVTQEDHSTATAEAHQYPAWPSWREGWEHRV